MGKIRVGDETIDVTLAVGPGDDPDPVQEITTFGSVTVQYDMAVGTTISLVIAGNDPASLHVDELATDIWLMGDLTERFRAWAVWQDWDHQGDDRVSIQGVTYDRLLNRRHVMSPAGLSFAAGTDQGAILWGFWQHTQAQTNGDLGVTLGTPNVTGITRSANYEYGDNLGAMAENLSKMDDGPWWIVNADKELIVRMPDAFDFIAQPLQLGVNCHKLQRAATGADFGNVVFGDADAETTTPVVASTAGLATDPRGRWEVAKAWPSVKVQATLQSHVDGALLEANTPLTHWNIEMKPERWAFDSRLGVGDFAVLVVPPSLAGPVGAPAEKIAVQVTSMAVQFTADGELNVRLVAMERDVALP